jgi:hypothetical protein
MLHCNILIWIYEICMTKENLLWVLKNGVFATFRSTKRLRLGMPNTLLTYFRALPEDEVSACGAKFC